MIKKQFSISGMQFISDDSQFHSNITVGLNPLIAKADPELFKWDL